MFKVSQINEKISLNLSIDINGVCTTLKGKTDQKPTSKLHQWDHSSVRQVKFLKEK